MNNIKLIVILTSLGLSYLFYKYQTNHTDIIITAELAAYKVINQVILNHVKALMEINQQFKRLIQFEAINCNMVSHIINYYKETYGFSDSDAALLVKYHILSNSNPFIPQDIIDSFCNLNFDYTDHLTCSTVDTTKGLSTIAEINNPNFGNITEIQNKLGEIKNFVSNSGTGYISYTDKGFPLIAGIDFTTFDWSNLDSDISNSTSEELDIPSNEMPSFNRNTSISGKSISEASVSSSVSDLTTSPLKKRR